MNKCLQEEPPPKEGDIIITLFAMMHGVVTNIYSSPPKVFENTTLLNYAGDYRPIITTHQMRDNIRHQSTVDFRVDSPVSMEKLIETHKENISKLLKRENQNENNPSTFCKIQNVPHYDKLWATEEEYPKTAMDCISNWLFPEEMGLFLVAMHEHVNGKWKIIPVKIKEFNFFDIERWRDFGDLMGIPRKKTEKILESYLHESVGSDFRVADMIRARQDPTESNLARLETALSNFKVKRVDRDSAKIAMCRMSWIVDLLQTLGKEVDVHLKIRVLDNTCNSLSPHILGHSTGGKHKKKRIQKPKHKTLRKQKHHRNNRTSKHMHPTSHLVLQR